MAKSLPKPCGFALPIGLTAEEKRHKELQEKYKEMRKKLAEKKAAADKGDKKLGKRTTEEAEEATHELIKKIQEGKITMKKKDEDKHTFKRLRLASTTEGGKSTRSVGEDGEILDPYEDDLEVSQSVLWQERRMDTNHNQKTIYVKGNDLQRDILRETFEKYGNIRRINVADRQRHAFIEFSHGAEAEMAVREMNDNTIGGDKIHVSLARRRDDTNYTRERAPASAFDDLGPRNII